MAMAVVEEGIAGKTGKIQDAAGKAGNIDRAVNPTR